MEQFSSMFPQELKLNVTIGKNSFNYKWDAGQLSWSQEDEDFQEPHYIGICHSQLLRQFFPFYLPKSAAPEYMTFSLYGIIDGVTVFSGLAGILKRDIHLFYVDTMFSFTQKKGHGNKLVLFFIQFLEDLGITVIQLEAIANTIAVGFWAALLFKFNFHLKGLLYHDKKLVPMFYCIQREVTCQLGIVQVFREMNSMAENKSLAERKNLVNEFLRKYPTDLVNRYCLPQLFIDHLRCVNKTSLQKVNLPRWTQTPQDSSLDKHSDGTFKNPSIYIQKGERNGQGLGYETVPGIYVYILIDIF
jgi:hypothetical protein